jgi:hypothetical protein
VEDASRTRVVGLKATDSSPLLSSLRKLYQLRQRSAKNHDATPVSQAVTGRREDLNIFHEPASAVAGRVDLLMLLHPN